MNDKSKKPYRETKERTLHCGCLEKEEVDAKSGYYVWKITKTCEEHDA